VSEALQAALAGEYAVMYAYGRAGARLEPVGQAQALIALEEHRTRRDQLRDWLTKQGQDPLPPAPAYQVPSEVRGDAAAREFLGTVELRLIPLYVEVIAEAFDDQEQRLWAIRCVRESALTAQSWGAAGQAFPWPEGEISPV
jgi:hypothetical protein